MLNETIIDIILNHIGSLKTSPSGWRTQNCKMCVHNGHRPDTKGRFGLKVTDDISIGMHCFNCGFITGWKPGGIVSKNLENLMTVIDVPDEIIRKAKFECFKSRQEGYTIDTDQPTIKRMLTSKWTEIELTDDFQPIQTWLEYECTDAKFKKVYDYVLKRCINPRDVLWTPKNGNRFYLPFYYNGKLVGHTARLGNDNKVVGIKYINTMPEGYIYNLDAQRSEKRKYCILLEGVLDAYYMSGISTSGNTISDDQIQIINNMGKDVIVCPDRDKSGSTLIDVAVKNGWKVSFPNWGDNVKDAGNAVQEYGYILTLRSIIESAISNPVKIHVARKLDKFNE